MTAHECEQLRREIVQAYEGRDVPKTVLIEHPSGFGYVLKAFMNGRYVLFAHRIDLERELRWNGHARI